MQLRASPAHHGVHVEVRGLRAGPALLGAESRDLTRVRVLETAAEPVPHSLAPTAAAAAAAAAAAGTGTVTTGIAATTFTASEAHGATNGGSARLL